jgi:lactoylglutathione lyase
MNFLWCTIDVEDIDVSLKFYQEIVGLSLKKRFSAGQDTEIAFLGDQPTQIELICNKNHKVSGNKKQGMTLGFEVNSIEDMISFLKNKGYETRRTLSAKPSYKVYLYI